MKKTRIDQLKKILNNELSAEQKKLLPFISMESQKNYVQFRVPEGIFELETLWKQIKVISKKNNLNAKRYNTFATAAELSELLSDIRFLWQNWIPYGMVTLLIAQPGLGKSAIALDLIKRVTEGSPMPLNNVAEAPCNVVWVEAENAQQILMQRIGTMNIQANKIYMPIIDGSILNTPKLNNESHRNEIRRIVEAKKPSLLVIDSLGGAKDGGENKVEEVKPFFDFITALARDSEKLAIVLIHHFNKGSDENSVVKLNKVRGSSLISAACRSIIALEQPRPNEIKMELIKSNVASPQKSLSLKMLFDENKQLTGIRYGEYTPAPKVKSKTQKCAEWLTDILSASNAPIRVKDIIEKGKEQNFTKQNIYSAKKYLGETIYSQGTKNMSYWNFVSDSDAIKQIENYFNKK